MLYTLVMLTSDGDLTSPFHTDDLDEIGEAILEFVDGDVVAFGLNETIVDVVTTVTPLGIMTDLVADIGHGPLVFMSGFEFARRIQP